ALFRTAQGTSQQILTNTLSPALLWAFSTTAEDMAVRDALYASHGVERTLAILSALHPGGLKSEAERRKNLRRFDDPYAKSPDVVSEIIDHLRSLLDAGGAQKGTSGEPDPVPDPDSDQGPDLG
ncbi:MAG: hypothetical protein LBJ61_11380, partial [Deltaproteobacteria bacterium]|nr:hypothetical protein [Deltaproteobacteria bacterium]